MAITGSSFQHFQPGLLKVVFSQVQTLNTSAPLILPYRWHVGLSRGERPLLDPSFGSANPLIVSWADFQANLAK